MADPDTDPLGKASAPLPRVVSVGLCVLAGFFCAALFLAHALPGTAGIDLIVVAAFVLTGVSLVLFLRAPREQERAASPLRLAVRVCALAAVVIGVGGLAVVWCPWMAGAGGWLSSLTAGHPFPGTGRFAPTTALNFILLGGALFVAGNKNRSIRFGADFAAAIVAATSFLSVLGHAYVLELSHESSAPIPSNLPIALAFFILSVPFLFAHNRSSFLEILSGDNASGAMARRLLPAAILTPVIIGWLSWRGEEAGFYHGAFGEAAETVGNIVVLTALVWSSARGLFAADARRKLAEMSRRESEELFFGTFEHSPIGVALVSPAGRWLKVNQALCELFGYSEAELVGQSFQAITHPDDLALGREKLGQMVSGEIRVVQVEKRYVHRSGRVLTALLNSSLVRDESGQPLHLISHIQDISERKQAEKELRWKTAFLEAQVNSSLDGILVVDTNGRATLRNERFIELWKVPPHIGVGEDDEQQLRWVMDMVSDPGVFVERVAYLYAHPDETSREEIALKDGRFFDRDSAPVIGKDGTHYGRIWTFRDITERKRMEDSLRESEARYQQIAANVPGMVFQFVLHPDGSFSLPFVSEGCREIYGAEPVEIQNDPRLVMDVIHPDDLPGQRASIAASAASLTPWSWQGRIHWPETGKTRQVEGASRPQGLPNGDILWDGVMVDITERKMAEENRRAKEEAERTNQEKSKFLSRMSHELRTPLNAILGFGQVLEFSALNEQDAAALGYILKGGRHLLSLIDEVLDLSRAESGDLRLALGRVDAGAVARECVGLVARLAEARRIECVVEGPSDPVARWLWCDELRLRQMLLNLLSNAIKYNCEGGRVVVRFDPAEGDRLRIAVSDTGAGISPEGMARLFVPFERLEHENGEIEGTGLGLVVARRIAEAMGGSLGAESEVGTGSTFWIELPLAEREPPPSPVEALLIDAPMAAAGVSPEVTLLYIEDNASNLQVVKMLLARCRPHWRFVSSVDGADGLEQARRFVPEVILLDLQMPGMRGDAVLEALRRDPLTGHIPVIVLSADATRDSRTRLLDLGAEAYVSKPFALEEMLELIDAMLGKTALVQAGV